MGEKENVTIMVLKVDLQCDKCYKKVKKVLCKFPQIRDQKYEEKQNQVEIKVVSSSPEKIRDKIYCKAGCCIKSIEIKKPQKPPTDNTKNPPPVHVNVCCTCIVCSQEHPGGTCYRGSGCGQGPKIQCDGFCGRPACDSCCGSSRGCGVTRPYCCSEEKCSACRKPACDSCCGSSRGCGVTRPYCCSEEKCSACRKPACDSYCDGSRGCSEANPCPVM